MPYTLAAVALVAAATIASGRATPLTALLDSQLIEQTIAGSKGDMGRNGRESSILARRVISRKLDANRPDRPGGLSG